MRAAEGSVSYALQNVCVATLIFFNELVLRSSYREAFGKLHFEEFTHPTLIFFSPFHLAILLTAKKIIVFNDPCFF